MKKVISRVCPTCGREFSADEELSLCPDDRTLLATITDDPFVGELVAGRYEILACVGQGGWSSVYKARDRTLNRRVAVKIMHEHLSSHADRVKRFQQEAEAAANLTHPNIAFTYDYGLLQGGTQPYIVMEFLQGRTLADLLDEGPLPYRRVIDLLLPACEGLQAAHDRGIVHRDIKPSNILVIIDQSGQETVKIVDFGLAKVVESVDGQAPAHLTQTGSTLGTPAYMSPEQCTGRVLDRRSDIYALGCVLYEALTGTKAFTGDNPFDCMLKHLNEVPPGFAMLDSPPVVPPRLEQAIFRCLAKDPKARFQTAKELSAELRLSYHELPGNPMRLSAVHRIIVPIRRIRLKSSWIAAGLVALTVTGSASFVVSRLPPPASDEPDKTVRTTTLPFKEYFTQAELAILDPSVLDDRILAEKIEKNRDYEELDLNKSQVTDEGLAVLKQAPMLKSLNLRGTRITDAGMAHISQLPTLMELDLQGTLVTNHGLSMLPSLTKLMALGVSPHVTDQGMRYIASLPRLEFLNLNENRRLTDAGIKMLQGGQFKLLKLDLTLLSDEGLRVIGEMSSLQRLYISNTAITDRGLSYLAGLKKLKVLMLNFNKITDAGVAQLPVLDQLEELGLSDCPGLTDAATGYIARMPSLLILRLSNTRISDHGLSRLSALPNLVSLNVKGCTAITSRGIDRLKRALPHCRIESDISGIEAD